MKSLKAKLSQLLLLVALVMPWTSIHAVDEFQEAVRTGENVHHAPAKPQAPVVHKAPKTGRNDPCFCGSGKKFKKCHGA